MREILTDNLPLFLFSRDSKLDQRLDPPVHQRLDELDLPTLILSGDQDHRLARANADTWKAAISGAQKVVIPDAAHLANMDQPERFNQVVLGLFGWLLGCLLLSALTRTHQLSCSSGPGPPMRQ